MFIKSNAFTSTLIIKKLSYVEFEFESESSKIYFDFLSIKSSYARVLALEEPKESDCIL